MDENITSPQERSFSGASSLDEPSGLHPAVMDPMKSEAPDDMPLIVWLRGDEPYIDEFCLDADAAMKVLGIKRSRLTQISGRELRVGRLRVDRYTRPVYRIEDIEQYKSWTRATASHLKASSVIQEAASKLEEQSKDLSDSLKQVFEEQTFRLESEIADLKSEVNSQRDLYLQETKKLTEGTQQAFFDYLNRSTDELKLKIDEMRWSFEQILEQQKMIEQTLKAHEKHGESVDLLKTSLEAHAAKVEAVGSEQKQAQETQLQFNRDLGKALGMVLQFQRESIKKSEESVAMSKELIAKIEAKDKEEQPAAVVDACPKRRIPFALRRRLARKM